MINRGIKDGRIVLMSSTAGVIAFLNLGPYDVTKAGVSHMAKIMAIEIGKYGITVNTICPGVILTERTLVDDPEFEANWAGVTPSGQVGYVEDIVATTMFLCTPEARHVNGQSIVVDGGWSLVSPLPEGHPEEPPASSKLI